MIMIRHIVTISLRVTIDGHHIVGPALKLRDVFIATLLRKVAERFLTIARIRMLHALDLCLALCLAFLNGLVCIVLRNSVFYDTFARDADASNILAVEGCLGEESPHDGAIAEREKKRDKRMEAPHRLTTR